MTNEATADKKRSLVKCPGPGCKETMQRIGRTFFMRLLIGSKCYYCRECRQQFLVFLGHYFPC